MLYISLDGVPATLKPDGINWEDKPVVGHRGNGAPIYGLYQACRLSFSFVTAVDLDDWKAIQDSASHTLILPHPKTGTLTTFTGCYLETIDTRLDARDDCEAVMTGADIRVSRITVS